MKKILIYAAIALLLLSGSFWAGRSTAPVEVQEKVVEKIVEKEAVVINKKVDVEKLLRRAKKEWENKNIKRTVVTVVKKDGSKVTKEVTEDKSRSGSKSKTAEKTTKKTEHKVWKETVRIEESIRLVERLREPSDWILDISGGYRFSSLWGRGVEGTNLIPTQNVVAGASLTRRIWGPAFAQVSVDTTLNAQAGLLLRWTW